VTLRGYRYAASTVSGAIVFMRRSASVITELLSLAARRTNSSNVMSAWSIFAASSSRLANLRSSRSGNGMIESAGLDDV
jgi:hypothetical protein